MSFVVGTLGELVASLLNGLGAGRGEQEEPEKEFWWCCFVKGEILVLDTDLML